MVGGEGVLQNAYLNDGKMAWSSPFGLKLTKEPLLAVSAVLHQVPDTKFQFQQVIFSPFSIPALRTIFLTHLCNCESGSQYKTYDTGNGIFHCIEIY